MMGEKYNLIAYEPEGAFEPKIVEFIKGASYVNREDFVWAKVHPLFVGIKKDVDLILLATRHQGESLAKRLKFPVHVYVCAVKNEADLLAERLEKETITILNWGLLLDINDRRTSVWEIYSK
jgi:hypothetical protein